MVGVGDVRLGVVASWGLRGFFLNKERIGTHCFWPDFGQGWYVAGVTPSFWDCSFGGFLNARLFFFVVGGGGVAGLGGGWVSDGMPMYV